MTETEIHHGTVVPVRHLTTTVPTHTGTLWLYGFRGHDGTARFTLILDADGDTSVVFADADWPTAWKAMAGTLYKPSRLAELLHCVLPEEETR